MNTLTFDTHDIIKKFREKGLNEDLAEYQVEAIKDMVKQAVNQVQHNYELDKLVTNKDLDARIKETELKIELVKADLQRDIETIRKEIAESKDDLRKWMTTVVFGTAILQTAIIAALVLKLAGHI